MNRLLVFVLLFGFSLPAQADLLYFTTGKSLEGIVTDGSGTLFLDLATGGQLAIPTDVVSRVEYAEVLPTDTPTQTPTPYISPTRTPTPTMVYTPKERYKDAAVLEAFKRKWAAEEEKRKKAEAEAQQQQGRPAPMMMDIDPGMLGPM